MDEPEKSKKPKKTRVPPMPTRPPLVSSMLNHPSGAYRWQKKYDPSINEHIPELYEGGRTDCEVAVDIGISEKTFKEWRKIYPAFEDAVQMGKAIAKKWMIEHGREAAVTRSQYKTDGKIWHILMRNCHDFDDNKETVTKEDLKQSTEQVSDLIKQYARDY